MSEDDKINIINEEKIENIPLIPARGIVIFPYMVIPLLVGREKSIEALEKAMIENEKIIVAAQKDENLEEPAPEDIYKIGTISEIKQLIKLPNGMIKVVVEGKKRARILEYNEIENHFSVKAETIIHQEPEITKKLKAYMRAAINHFKEYINYIEDLTPETVIMLKNIEEADRLADIIVSHLDLNYKKQQKLLETVSLEERFIVLLGMIKDEVEILSMEQDLNKKVHKQVKETQKKYYLREKLKVIKDELDEEDNEINDYKNKKEKLQLPEKVDKKVNEEIEKLKKTPTMSPESTVIRNYLDCVLDLPWNKTKSGKIDIKKAEKILNQDHYDLEDVKERILEYLAVQKRSSSKKGPILCLVGGPGVGKTSLGRSIARALNRDFVRLSLGGVRDEAEIKGHRRTYIGSRAGRIINSLRDAGSKNPVFLLDEVDKMSADFRGDPAAALLEVLDPEQNNNFTDHYLEIPFDLSRVLFVTTANVTNTIPAPLLDRMEVIELPGYTEYEKIKIAENYLLPRLYKDHGISKEELQISTNAVKRVIQEYTREAGVRNLEKKLAALIRKITREIVEGRDRKARITIKNVNKYLGIPLQEFDRAKTEKKVGVATGMAYNQAGGDIIEIEVAVVPGSGELNLTGSLGEVMKESAQAALTYIRSKHDRLDLPDKFYDRNDLHIHVPKGAVPKDGPSAGITIALAIASALTEQPVCGGYAMSGEISLRGQVLPVGGIKTKILAARRRGIKNIILPEKNKKNIEEIESEITKNLNIKFVKHMDQVLKLLLEEKENEN